MKYKITYTEKVVYEFFVDAKNKDEALEEFDRKVCDGDFVFNDGDIAETATEVEEFVEGPAYVICYEDDDGPKWEFVYGDDAMQVRVNELMEILDCDAEDIMVFENGTQL